MSVARVAVVGTGRMGGAMAARLRAGGVGVTVFNRTADRAAAVAERTGADVAPTARDAVAAADVVLVSLADDAACEAAYDGPDGIVAGVHAGTLVADTSTIDPRTAVRLGDLVRGAGGAHLDAPVSGSVPSVERGNSPSWPAATRPTWTGPGRCWTTWRAGSSTWGRPVRARSSSSP